MDIIDHRLFRNPPTWKPSFYQKDWFSLQTSVLQWVSIMPIKFQQYLPNNLAYISPILNNSIVIIETVSILHIVFLCILELLTTYGNDSLEHITYLIIVLIVGVFSLYGLHYLFWAKSKYMQTVKFINTNFLYRSAFGVTCVTGEQSYLYAKRFTFYWTGACVVATIQWVLVAIWLGDCALPVNVANPWVDQRASPYFEITFIFHSIYQFFSGMGFAVTNFVFFSITILICGQFDILFCSLKNLRNTAMIFDGGYLKELK